MNLLKQLELDELSLVDRPANASAKVALFKRDNSEGEITMTDKVEKMSDDMKSKLKPYMDKGMSAVEAEKAYNMANLKKSEEPVEEPTEIDTLKAENQQRRIGSQV